MGKNKEALADYNRALKLHPQAPEILHNRGLAHLNLGQAREALRDGTRSWNSTPISPGPNSSGPGPWKSWTRNTRPWRPTANS